MIAVRENDICYSTIKGGPNIFNTDGETRDSISIDEARKAFAFNIVKRENFDVQGRLIPGQWHLEKDTDGSIIPSVSVGDRYTPIQHLDAFEHIVNHVMPGLPGAKLVTVGTIHGGGVGIVVLSMGDDLVVPGDSSTLSSQIIFNNPSNGEGRMTVGFTTKRLLCENQLMAAIHESKENGWNVVHTKSAQEMSAFALDSIRDQARSEVGMRRRILRLASVNVSVAMVHASLERVYPYGNLEKDSRAYLNVTKLREEVLEEFESGHTAETFSMDNGWKLFNSYTYGIFNPRKVRKTMDMAEVQYSGMFGTRAVRVRRTLQGVEEVLFGYSY